MISWAIVARATSSTSRRKSQGMEGCPPSHHLLCVCVAPAVSRVSVGSCSTGPCSVGKGTASSAQSSPLPSWGGTAVPLQCQFNSRDMGARRKMDEHSQSMLTRSRYTHQSHCLLDPEPRAPPTCSPCQVKHRAINNAWSWGGQGQGFLDDARMQTGKGH